jgi:hypothetical protein
MGHLAEAESESLSKYRGLAFKIREVRKAYENDPDAKIDIMNLIKEATKLDEAEGGDS